MLLRTMSRDSDRYDLSFFMSDFCCAVGRLLFGASAAFDPVGHKYRAISF